MAETNLIVREAEKG
ncbi:hypothetical protein MPK20_004124 [Escherichia coli]|nr:hypothetical protein [Escherichia coli]EIG3848972.1 hypothetical protein [Escherichia coli]EIH6653022.1 hypothetical protein [Escherichia coli]EIZ1454817.1 hypothetical protein [Escherichia coli]EKP2913540.1 hypothetical protein [Escherichia coli]